MLAVVVVPITLVLVMMVPATSADCTKVLIEGVKYTVDDTP